MKKLINQFIIYQEFSKDPILCTLSDTIDKLNNDSISTEDALVQVNSCINSLLNIATKYGFNKNLWQNYLAFLLATTPAPFALCSEMHGAPEGSVDILAEHDFELIGKLYDYDFSTLEKKLSINTFSIITNYLAVKKSKTSYNAGVSALVQELSDAIAASSGDSRQIFKVVTDFYGAHGVGTLGLNAAFRLANDEHFELVPITNLEKVKLDDIIGYEYQKKTLYDNTKAFVCGRPANNVLLYGDPGTGKSTSIKAILNEFYADGLRMIEVYKHQFHMLPQLISEIKNRNYRFIIYMDDLSFEEFETEYKYLKAIIEGGLEIKPKNVLIYATSNRRHLIRETWSDRSDMSNDDLHRSDTVAEKLSLVARFGLSIGYMSPDQRDFYEIVKGLASRHPELNLTEAELLSKANSWEVSHGGRSGRTAEQFIKDLLAAQK